MADRHEFTDEERSFLREVIPGHTWRETSELFRERFGFALTENQVVWQRRALGVRSGFRGARKGCAKTSSSFKAGNRIGLATRFQAGNIPKQGGRFKVGDERTDKDGYVWVKVSESGHDNRKATRSGMKCWRLKHHIVWEEAHGASIPEGYAVIFANRDKMDFTPGNIVAVPRGVLSTMSSLHIDYYDAESLQSAMTLAKIRMKLKGKRKEAKDALRDNQ